MRDITPARGHALDIPFAEDRRPGTRLEPEVADRAAQLAAQEIHARASLAKVRWIVGGAVAVVAMLISAIWSLFTRYDATMRTLAANSHEIALKAVEAVKAEPATVAAAPNQDGGDGVVLGAMLALAAICIIIGLVGKVRG